MPVRLLDATQLMLRSKRAKFAGWRTNREESAPLFLDGILVIGSMVQARSPSSRLVMNCHRRLRPPLFGDILAGLGLSWLVVVKPMKGRFFARLARGYARQSRSRQALDDLLNVDVDLRSQRISMRLKLQELAELVDHIAGQGTRQNLGFGTKSLDDPLLSSTTHHANENENVHAAI